MTQEQLEAGCAVVTCLKTNNKRLQSFKEESECITKESEMTNRERLIEQLEKAYADLFANDPDYAYAAARTTPNALAVKMADGLITGGANREGVGIKRACKALGLKPTYKSIQAFCKEGAQ